MSSSLQLPFFSVIIPTYQRPKQLSTCLQSLANVRYPHNRFEVIVVDDGSETPLEDIIATFSKHIYITLITQPNAGPAVARNTGAKQAKGEFLAFTDDDCTLSPDWLSALSKQFVMTPCHIIGGKTINKLSHNPYSFTSQLIINILYQHYNACPGHARFFTSNNMAIPAKLLREVGGFHPDFRNAEDRELCDRWLFNGYQMTYAPEAVVYHAHDLSFYGFCKQYFGHGRWAYHFHKIRSRRGSGTMRGEMKFHMNICNWLFSPFRQVKGIQVLIIVPLMILWQVFNAAGFFWEAVKQTLYILKSG